MINFKNIHIGSLIRSVVENDKIEINRLCSFLDCTEKDIVEMFGSEHMHTDILLKWSKLLKYDFFRVYSQHLILYSPPQKINSSAWDNRENSVPILKKNLYTTEIITFILQLIRSGEKSAKQITNEYNIPKSTLSKWMSKY